MSDVKLPGNFKVTVQQAKFADVLSNYLDCSESARQVPIPTFAFVDPFGFSGIPMELMWRLLSLPKCEVFVNVMIEYINRFLEHPDKKVVAHFPTTFGTEEILSIPTSGSDRIQAIVELYGRQLKRHAKFTDRFDMHGKRNQHTYSLFFASNSSTGFVKMKEAMWSVDDEAGESFSDSHSNKTRQSNLFKLEPLLDELLTTFQGQQVLMRDIDRFVSEQTRFLKKHAREVLKTLESRGEISVKPVKDHKRKRNTFPPAKVFVVFPS